ncbi:Protein yipf3 [Balamuthia mandrillaris]
MNSQLTDRNGGGGGEGWYKPTEEEMAEISVDVRGFGQDEEGAAAGGSSSGAFSFSDNQLVYQVAGRVFETAKNQSLLNLSGYLDHIRPYFDVEPKTVARRLGRSLVPRPSSELLEGSPDLYGPLVLVLTLVAVLLMEMKLNHVSVKEGTLMGTSFAVCFTYWLVASFVCKFIAYLCSMQLSTLEALALIGYGLFGYCITLTLHCLSSLLSLISLFVVGGLSSATLGAVFFGQIKNSNKMYAMVAGGCVFALHFLFLAYLRYFYSAFYDAAADAFKQI